MPPSQRIGAYEVTGTLGQGGMGAVYRARRADLGGVERAVKVLLRLGDVRGLLRFEREAANLARVRHPNVVAVHEVGTDDGGRPYLVMDLVEGTPLDRALEDGPVRPLDRALALVEGVARGVDALHAAGIVHRDLKPQNVVLAADGRPVVIDLGLAVAPGLDERLTKTGALVGTPRYLAPEQVAGGAPTPATDVHALGLLLHEVVTGEAAVGGASTPELVARVVAGVVARPTAVDPSLPAALDDLVAACTARDPARRLARGGEVAERLARLRAAPGPSRRALRTRRAVAAALAVGAGLGLAGVGVWWPWRGAGGGDGAASPGPRGRAPGPATEAVPDAEAAAAARALARLAPAARVPAAEAWLARSAAHPDAGRVRAALAAALREVPVRVLPQPAVEGALFVDAGGARVAAWGSDGQARLWDVAAARQVRAWPLPWPALAGALAPDGRTLVVGGQGAVAWLDLEGAAPPRLLPVPASVVRALAVSPRGDVLAVAGERGALHLVAAADGRVLRAIGAHRSPVNTVRFTPDGARLLTASGAALDAPGASDCAVRVLDAASGEVEARMELVFLASDVTLAPDGTLVACGNANRVLRYALDGTPLGEVHGEGTALAGDFDASAPALAASARRAAVTRDGARLVAVTGDLDAPASNELRVWDARTGRQRLRAGRAGPGLTLDLSADGARAAVAGGGTIDVWALEALGGD